MEPFITFTVLVALTIGVTEVVKRLTKITKQITPAVALAVGVVLTFIGSVTNLSSVVLLDSILLSGIVVGLSASGLFDQKLLFPTKK